MPTTSTPGRSIVTRRAVVDIVRAATLGSYGVTGFAGGPMTRLLERIGVIQPGIDITLGDARTGRPEGGRPAAAPVVQIDLDLTVAYGVPVAEVARQVDSAVRYAIRRALRREIARLTIHVDGLRYQPGALPVPPPPASANAIRADDLARSGTDVA